MANDLPAMSAQAQALAAAGLSLQDIEAQLVREGNSPALARQVVSSVKGWVPLPQAHLEPSTFRWSRRAGYVVVGLAATGVGLLAWGMHSRRPLFVFVALGLVALRLVQHWRKG